MWRTKQRGVWTEVQLSDGRWLGMTMWSNELQAIDDAKRKHEYSGRPHRVVEGKQVIAIFLDSTPKPE
jgi:hypothetical protein